MLSGLSILIARLLRMLYWSFHAVEKIVYEKKKVFGKGGDGRDNSDTGTLIVGCIDHIVFF